MAQEMDADRYKGKLEQTATLEWVIIIQEIKDNITQGNKAETTNWQHRGKASRGLKRRRRSVGIKRNTES